MTSALSWPLPCFIPYSKAKFACYSRCFLTSYFCIPVPYNEKDIAGVQPQRIQGIRSGDGIGEGKNLFIYLHKIRLGRNSVVGKLSGEKRLNNLVYVESQ